LASSAKASSLSPSSTSISTVGGWMVGPRCSSGGSASASWSVPGLPFLTKPSAATPPTGPAPPTTTRPSPCTIPPADPILHTGCARLRGRGPGCLSDFRNLEHRRMEQLLGGDLTIDQALLVGVLRQRRDLAHVLLDAVRPEVFSHDRHGLLRFRDQPRQR